MQGCAAVSAAEETTVGQETMVRGDRLDGGGKATTIVAAAAITITTKRPTLANGAAFVTRTVGLSKCFN